MWVTNSDSGTVTKLSPTGATLGTFAVGAIPVGIAFDGTNMWVTNIGSANVTKLSPTGVTLGTYAVGARPMAVAFDGRHAWVVNSFDNSVTELPRHRPGVESPRTPAQPAAQSRRDLRPRPASPGRIRRNRRGTHRALPPPMNKPLPRSLIAGVIGHQLPACAKPAPPPDARTFSFSDGARSAAWVRRTVGGDGRETLHGETSVVSGAVLTQVVEDAELDAGGRLVRAEITVGAGGSPEEQVVLDFEQPDRAATTPGGPVAWSVPADAPWAYAPMARGVSTPVAAWITRGRAASTPRSSGSSRSTSSYRTADQIAIATELGTTVVLGGDGADVDRAFVARLRWLIDRGVVLERQPRSAHRRPSRRMGRARSRQSLGGFVG